MSNDSEHRSLEELCIDAAIWGSDLEIAAELRAHADSAALRHEFELAAAIATAQFVEEAATAAAAAGQPESLPPSLLAAIERRAAEWCERVDGQSRTRSKPVDAARSSASERSASGRSASGRSAEGPRGEGGPSAPGSRRSPAVDPAATSRMRSRGWLGWSFAAAALVLAAFGWLRDPRPAPSPRIDLVALRGQLLAEPDVARHAWAVGPSEFAGTEAAGDVVWSDRLQTGVMRFRGLPKNRPDEVQYQLWIFDAARDSSKPVDGGVFDVPADDEEVLVPIHAKLRVFEGKAFVVTRERAGGVVVSDREHIVRVANL